MEWKSARLPVKLDRVAISFVLLIVKGKNMYYVTMTDKFMSGWGEAKNRINKLIFECASYEEAEIVADNSNSRSEMKNVNITHRVPYYNDKSYLVQVKSKLDSPVWFKLSFGRG